MYQRFTDRARRVIVLAQEEARALKHNYIGTEHILLGLLEEDEGVANMALIQLGVTPTAVRARVKKIIGEGKEVPLGHIPFTPRAKKVQELALREALQLGHNYIGTEHILLGLIREGEGVAAQVLVELGAELSRVRTKVIEVLGGSAKFTDSPPPAPEAVSDLASPVIDALLGIVGEMPRYVTSAIELALTGVTSDDLTKFIGLADAVRKQAKKAGSPVAKEAPTATEAVDEKDRLRAAMGLYSWLNGEPCPDPDAYTEIAKRLWKGAI